MRKQWLPFAAIGAILVICIGLISYRLLRCGKDGRNVLESADTIILYSIDPKEYEPGHEPKTDEKLLEYPVLGKVVVTDPSERQELIGAINAGITEHSRGFKCFAPRHAVRAVRGNQWVLYEICFQCGNVYEYSSCGDFHKALGVDAGLKEILNKRLEAAGVPLAPDPLPWLHVVQ